MDPLGVHGPQVKNPWPKWNFDASYRYCSLLFISCCRDQCIGLQSFLVNQNFDFIAHAQIQQKSYSSIIISLNMNLKEIAV